MDYGIESVSWLLEVSEDELKELGVKPLHIKKMLKCVKEISEK